MKLNNLILIFCASCFLFSCPPRATQQEDSANQLDKVEAPNNQNCDTQVMVKDFTGMDGCRFMFVLNNGDKLMPNEMPLMDFKLAANQIVKISYSVVKDALSACMMENFIIKVNCIELISETGGVKPVKTACVKVDNYTKSKWLQNLVGDMDPNIITRFTYLTDGWAYLIDNGFQKKLIDCQGTEICVLEGKAMGPCYDRIRNLGKEGVVIFSKNDVRND